MKTLPTIKTVKFGVEDAYRKKLMVAWLKTKNMLSNTAEKHILKNYAY